MPKHVLFAGATGLVGSLLLRRLKADPRVERITLVARRATGLDEGKVSTKVVDFARLGEGQVSLPPADAAVCALGTTLKAAGSREAFAAVDCDAVVAFARAARKAGVDTFAVVSALGADAHSRVFYNRVKGQAEEALESIGFPRLHLLRPSLLVGERKDVRPAERIGVALAPFLKAVLVGPLAKWAPVNAEDVAESLHRALFDDTPGVHVHASETLGRAGGRT